ncbi:MAG: threonine/serine exporter family protein [Anaerococcus sp.]
MDILLEFIISLIATMGFAYSFSAPKTAVIFSGLVGATGWVIYFVLIKKINSIYISTTVAAFVVGTLGEIFARKFRMPSSCFTIPGILALAPGTSIFYMTSYFINNNRTLAIEKMFDAIVISGSISFGILLASVWSRSLRRFKLSNRYRTKNRRKKIK